MLSILRHTHADKTITVDRLAELSRTPQSILHIYLEDLARVNFLSLPKGEVSTTDEQRIALAIRALQEGSDPERVCRELDWQEFEDISMIALDSNGYRTTKHFIFKHGSKRWEIDLVGVGERLVLCIDCKHWMYGWHRSRIASAARQQIERTRALAAQTSNVMEKLKLPERAHFTFLPVLVTLADVASRTTQNIPIVPILRIRTFLSELSNLVSPPFQTFIGNATRLTGYFGDSSKT